MLDIVQSFTDDSWGILARFFPSHGELKRSTTRSFSPPPSLSLARRSPLALTGRRRYCLHQTGQPRKHRCNRGDGRGSALPTGTNRGEPPFRGRTGLLPAGPRSHPRGRQERTIQPAPWVGGGIKSGCPSPRGPESWIWIPGRGDSSFWKAAQHAAEGHAACHIPFHPLQAACTSAFQQSSGQADVTTTSNSSSIFHSSS